MSFAFLCFKLDSSSECLQEDLSATLLGAQCCGAGGTAQLPERGSSAGAFPANGRTRTRQGARGPARNGAAGMAPGRGKVILNSSSVKPCLSHQRNGSKGGEIDL